MFHTTARLTFATLLMVTPYASAQADEAGKTTPRSITNEEHGLALELPAGWQQVDEPGALLAGKGPAGDGGSVAFNVRSLPGLSHAVIGEKSFIAGVHAGLAKNIEGYVADGDGKTQIAGGPGVWMRGNYPGNHLLNYAFAGDGQGFLVTFRYPAAGAEEHARSVATIMASVTIGAAKASSAEAGAKVVKGRVQAGHGFSLQMPAGWQIDPKSADSLLVLSGPNGMSINVRVLAALTKTPDPEAIAPDIERRFKETLGPDYEIRYCRPVRISKRSAVWLQADYTVKGQKLRNLQLLLPDEKRGFIVTCTIRAADWRKNIGKIKKTLRSIRLD